MPLRISIVLTFLAASIVSTLYAQTCTIQAGALKVCLGGTMSFSSSSSASDSAYAWKFGNGSTSTQASPTYQYPAAGTYTVELTKFLKGGGVCVASPMQVTVFHKPQARYVLQTPRTQCFTGNHFVFADSSRRGLSNAPITKRVFVFDDGAIIQQNAPFPPTVSHGYSNAAGSKYRVVIEVTDTNGCLGQFIDSVTVAPKRTPLVLVATQQVGCGQTKVVFMNQSPYDSTNSARIWWVVDSNVVLTSPWRTLSYTYNGNRTFRPRLIIEDPYGCRDSVQLGYDIVSFVPDSTIHIRPGTGNCFRNNLFTFSDSTRIGNLRWTITDEAGRLVDLAQGSGFQYSFKHCGLYNIGLEYVFPGCNFNADTQVFVYGPDAVISNDTVKPVNWVQCTIHDTVYFNKPDLNCRYRNNRLVYLWDFGDPFAPACTTDTRRGISVGMNCRYSLDSVDVKHYYSQLNEFCYWPNLVLRDTVLNCVDVDSVHLALAAPKAGWDSTVTPPRPRVYAIQSGCTNRVTFFLERLLPRCGPEKVWLLPDSPCTAWMPVDSIGLRKYYQHVYTSFCDTTKKQVTYGIVVTNGTDGAGQRCYDTSWYHLELERAIQVPFTALLKDTDRCSPHLYTFTPKDTIVKGINELAWDFGDGSALLRIPYGPDDSIVKPQNHVYTRDGIYSITLVIEGRNGCVTTALQNVMIGKNVVVVNNNPLVCNGAEAEFSADITYFNDPVTKYWDDTLRRNQGKEALYWNFGDTRDWVAGRETMKHTYSKAGVYQVRIAYKDSTPGGCFDTLGGSILSITVQVLKAQVYVITDTFYCAPAIVSFIDSSYVMNDSITKQYNVFRRVWDFGVERPVSTLPAPNVFYGANGTFKVSLYAESVFGCSDMGEAQVTIIGPEPQFVIQNDTFGCSPYTVRLKNETGKQLKNWIWYFNDQASTFISTSSDTDITFTYTQPGTYRIDLLGEEDVFNPVTGSFKNCTSKFPYVDADFPFHRRQVVVLASDTLHILSEDTICENALLLVTTPDSLLVRSVKWSWGDQSSDTTARSDAGLMHRYDTSGTYRLRIDPVITSVAECAIGSEKQVVVRKPAAGFTFDPRDYPTFTFKNSSVNAVRYLWDFGQPLGGSATSTAVDPTRTFTNENRVITVCLMAFDAEDCMDSVCKELPVRASVKIPNVFTPGNNDGDNDAFDIEIEGWLKYELYIYNRWGTLVFQGFKDGMRNDGINWDGRNRNDGSDCPDGVYFVVFSYQLLTSREEQQYRGTVTLIRDK